MIIIDNKPFDATELLNEYPPNSNERNNLEIMSSSGSKFRYDTLNQLKFELMLRREIVNAAKDLHRSKMDFEVFRESRCNPAYWHRTDEGGFVLKSGVKPSDAINDIFTNGSMYGTECATAMIIVYYKALLNVYGEELFNQTFRNIHLMNWHYIDRRLREIGTMRDAGAYLTGDRRYFANPDVNPLTPEWRGENTIDLGNGLYYGHGMGIYNADSIIRALNSNRREGSDKSAYQMDTVGVPNFERLANIYYQSEERTPSRR